MLDKIAEKTREYISRKALDFAETLPKFQGGRIHRMQRIRESDRRIADKHNEQSKQPNDANIKLSSLTLVLCYEFEQFSSVHNSLRKAFPNNKRIEEIRRAEAGLDNSSWSDLGTIVNTTSKYLPFLAVKQVKLPPEIERVHLSHQQLLPSLACLQLTIIVSEPFQEKIRSETERYYLPQTISQSLRPSKFFNGYYQHFDAGAKRAASKQIQNFIRKSSKFLLRTLKINSKHIHICAAHPQYQLEYPTQETLPNYAASKTAWLSKYGYTNASFHKYHSDKIIFCTAEGHNDLSPRIEPLFFVEQDGELFWIAIDGMLRGITSSSALLTRLTVYRNSIESLRAKGLMDLTAKWKVIRKSGETIYSLKHVILRSRRMLSEFKKSKLWLHHSLDEAADLKTEFMNQESTFSSNTFGFIESELRSLTQSATMLDQALSDRLATENIYVMYQLQRRVFWLTVVGVFIAAVGLLSVWDKLKEILHMPLTW